MSIFSCLYTLLIGPLELFFEILFSMANRVIDNPGLSIIFLSLAMNFLVLPLYKMADTMQADAQAVENKLAPVVAHIKKTFTGDERYMMLQTYYRQNNYKPTDALKGSVSLLLEIPFFMAAYNFLSGLPLLQGASLGPIQNLGSPDQMIVLGGFAINILPILMTAINLISSAIYTKGSSFKSKIQLYIMATLFLVLLYDSPSGLVFYWTLNNLFSLAKNIFMKLKNAKLILSILSSGAGILGLVFILFVHPMVSMRKQLLLATALLLLQLPIIFHVRSSHVKTNFSSCFPHTNAAFFHLGCLFITVLTGLLIPSTVIHSSPEEFINTYTYASPLNYLLSSALLAAGFFLIWFGIFYMLAGPISKQVMGLVIWIASICALVNYMFFGSNYGTLTSHLTFMSDPEFNKIEMGLNLLILVIVAFICTLLWTRKTELTKTILLTLSLVTIIMSSVNIAGIHNGVDNKIAQLKSQNGIQASIPLSKTGHNVIVLMLDRGISGYVPYLFNERPELKKQFDGFKYYPNTTSFGLHTNFGTPGIYGGYEYIPQEMNKRENESLKDKQNEALKVMPVLFSQNGFETTVCDPTYAGYEWIPNLDIYNDYPEIHRYNTMGKYTANPEKSSQLNDHILNRNFFCYSVFKISPLLLQPTLYASGNYNDLLDNQAQNMQQIVDPHTASGSHDRFMNAYTVLQNLPVMTEIIEDNTGSFLMMSNDTTHEPILLSEPSYEPAEYVDNTEYDALHSDRFTLNGQTLKMETTEHYVHYQSNMATYIQLGKWFDYLRDNGVYDNTRIILVSDHGRNIAQHEDWFFGNDFTYDVMYYNALLMVKDFNGHGFTTDNTFMTNADTPVLAMDKLIESPVNPFTKRPINNDTKYEDRVYITTSHHWDVGNNHGNTFLPDGWVSVHDDIFNLDNWEIIEYNHK